VPDESGLTTTVASSMKDLVEEPVELGRGGFSVVLHAQLDGIPLAVKVAKPSGKGVPEQTMEAFTSEAHLMRSAGFPHEHLCALFGTCLVAGLPAIVLEYFGGGALSEALGIRTSSNRQPRPELAALAERWRLAPQLASGLAHLHAQGILHCDIKTSNVLLRPDERHALGHAVLCDFGVSTTASREVGRAGTLRYMAPEVSDDTSRRAARPSPASCLPEASPSAASPLPLDEDPPGSMPL
jgi:serine/threonine protein kinase